MCSPLLFPAQECSKEEILVFRANSANAPSLGTSWEWGRTGTGLGKKAKWLNTQWGSDNSTDGTNGGKYTKSDKIILCKARSQEMVRDCQAWKVNTVHSLCNYTLFEHVPFLRSLAFFVIYGTGVLSVFPRLQHEVEGKKRKKKKSAADMPLLK